MKTILALALALCLATLTCLAAPTYADHISAASVAQLALDAIGSSADYIDGTVNNYPFYFGDTEADASINDRAMMYHKEDKNVNELGVLRLASDKDADAVVAAAEAYLAGQCDYLRGFAKNYSPADMDKIDNAGVRAIGCYVVYYILSPKDEAAALDAVRTALTAK